MTTRTSRPISGSAEAGPASTDIVDRLRQYNPPDRTIDAQRQMSMDIHEAADIIQALHVELDELKADIANALTDLTDQSIENDALRSRVAELEQDAARYRFMRDCATFRDRNGPGLYWYLPRFYSGSNAERLDAAIDAARKE